MKTLFLPSFTKRTSLLIYLSFILGAFFLSCQKDDVVTQESNTYPTPKFVAINPGSCYDITLVGGAPTNNGNGTYTWTWTFTNTAPGNGNNGTCQDLSHWDIVPGACLAIGDIVSAGYSADGWNYTSFIPTFGVDPSLGNACNPPINSGNVLKFEFETNGNAPSYYRLVVNKNFAVDPTATMYYKSGPTTGCGTGTFQGIGCPNVECTFTYPTGFAGGVYRNNSTSETAWFYYVVDYGNIGSSTIYANQTQIAGSLSQGANGCFNINLNPGWELANVSDAVKVWCFNSPPTSRPTGKTKLSGISWANNAICGIQPGCNNYVIHFDLVKCN